MKTYILNNIDRLTNYGKSLDVKSILYNKNWEVLNDDNIKEVLIFRQKGELLIVRKGVVSKGNWEILPTGSIVINNDSKILLFNTAFVDTNVLALQLDGTNECMIMVDSEAATKLMLDSIKNIEHYLQDKYATTEELHKITDIVSTRISKWKKDFRIIKCIGAFLCWVLFIIIILEEDSKYHFLDYNDTQGNNLDDYLLMAFPFIAYILISYFYNNKYLNYRIDKYKEENPNDKINPYLKANWRI